MKPESAHTVILGAGPAGLAAALEVARAGQIPVVLERGKEAGGLMRCIKHRGYCVDIGRKELYSRLPDVHALWSELLGADYRSYPHRIGVLYRGRVFERSGAFRGVRRGLPVSLIAAGGLDFAARQLLNPFLPPPRNEQEFWYRTRGRVFSRALSQGYKEKFSGHRWEDSPVPDQDAAAHPAARFKKAVRSVFGRAVARDSGGTTWRHPALGSGQITERLREAIESRGGQLRFGVAVQAVEVDGSRVVRIRGEANGAPVEFAPDHLVCAVPVDALARLLGREPPRDLKRGDTRKRSTVIVYLFVDEPPRLPHAWLDVTDPELLCGRITNFAGFGGEMVPPGKTCLAVEYFLVGDDPLLALTDDELVEVALGEATRAGLVDRARVESSLAFRFPGAYAADDYRSWQSPGVSAFLDDLDAIENLYYVNRAGTDVATQAGLDAGCAIVAGDHAGFVRKADPRRPLGIESTRLWA